MSFRASPLSIFLVAGALLSVAAIGLILGLSRGPALSEQAFTAQVGRERQAQLDECRSHVAAWDSDGRPALAMELGPDAERIVEECRALLDFASAAEAQSR